MYLLMCDIGLPEVLEDVFSDFMEVCYFIGLHINHKNIMVWTIQLKVAQ